MTYWFMRMKQGSAGEDFAAELWQARKIGVMFGAWRIKDVSDHDGRIDSSKLTVSHLRTLAPQPPGFGERFVATATKFLIGFKENDRVIMLFDNAVHIATIGNGFLDDSTPRGVTREFFKCRPIHSAKRFPLAELPSVYRLLSTCGRGAFCKLDRFLPHAHLLDQSSCAADVQASVQKMTVYEFLNMLSAEQWEVVCGEYLRDKIGFQFLLLSGMTLEDVDLVGVDSGYRRVVAQCKNDPKPWSSDRIRQWIDNASLAKGDSAYFFCRGGINGALDSRVCVVVDGEAIAHWLRNKPDYLRCLMTR